MTRALLAAALVLATPTLAQEGLGSAQAQRDALWSRVEAQPYATLPALGSAGFQHTFKDTAAAFNKSGLRRAFDTDQDQRELRTKTFHPFGTVAKVVFEPDLGTPGMTRRLPDGSEQQGAPAYTGLWKTGAVGLVRLSLADDADPYIPGVGLKLFVDGAPSANVLAIPSFAGQKSTDFFLRSPTNVLPGTADLGFLSKLTIGFFIRIQQRAVRHPLILSLDRLGQRERGGAEVEAPRSPHQLQLRPGDVHLPAESSEDFRVLLARSVPAGTVIYRVFGREKEGEWAYLGAVKTESGFVASAFGDKELHFVHHEWFPRPAQQAPQGE